MKYGKRKKRKEAPGELSPRARKSARLSLRAMPKREWKFKAEEKNLYGKRLADGLAVTQLLLELADLGYDIAKSATQVVMKWRKRIRDGSPFKPARRPKLLSDTQLDTLFEEVPFSFIFFFSFSFLC